VSAMHLPPGAINKDLRDLVLTAVRDFGWTAQQNRRNGSWTIYSKDRDERFKIPTTSGDSGFLVQELRTRIKRATAAEVERTKEALIAGGASNVDTNISMIDLSPTCGDCGMQFTTWDGFAAHQEQEHPAPPSPESLQERDETPDGVMVPDEVVEPVTAPVVDVQIEGERSPEYPGSTTMSGMEEDMQETLRPWRAMKQRFGNGQVETYESGAVWEVVVGDEVTAYQCRHCPWRADRPRSVVSHYAVLHIAKGEVPPTNRDTNLRTEDGANYIKTVTHRKWIVPSDEMTKVVYDFLLANPKRGNETNSVYAKRFTDAMVAEGYVLRPADEVTEVDDLVEATEAQMILDEIRALVGTDPQVTAELQAQVSTAQAAAAEALAEVGEMQAALEEAKTKVQEYSGFIRTIASFAKDEV
jgi:Zinc finger, C2H2 type